MNAHLLIRVTELAELRRAAAVEAELLAGLRRDFESDNAALIAKAKEAQQAVAEAERDVRALAEAEYKETGEKSVAPGVVVKERATMDYDKARALSWAQQTKMALIPESLDVKAFEKIAKASPLDFVTYGVEPMVTIAADLAKALAEVSA